MRVISNDLTRSYVGVSKGLGLGYILSVLQCFRDYYCAMLIRFGLLEKFYEYVIKPNSPQISSFLRRYGEQSTLELVISK